jgi:hypothetical protein
MVVRYVFPGVGPNFNAVKLPYKNPTVAPADPPIINPISAFCAVGGRFSILKNNKLLRLRFLLMEEPPAKRLRVELTDKEKEIIVDNARCHGTFYIFILDFFEFLTKYSDLPLECIFDAFGYKLPDNLLNASTDKLLPLLKVTIDRKIAKRPKRSDINTIEDVLELLKNSKKIMVITGAGMFDRPIITS